jgi:hypothetical protein
MTIDKRRQKPGARRKEKGESRGGGRQEGIIYIIKVGKRFLLIRGQGAGF